jgi:hypothetical protein
MAGEDTGPTQSLSKTEEPRRSLRTEEGRRSLLFNIRGRHGVPRTRLKASEGGLTVTGTAPVA